MIGSVDNFDGQQNLREWIQMVGRAAEFAGWSEEATFKAALFRLRGEAGELAEQLREEGKLKTWKELQETLKDRFETAGKEQWHQYLLNTGTQGSKTVQEWAQTVRKLSLLALASEDRIKEEGAVSQNAEEAQAAETARKEAKKKLLDYERRNNFVRGLRSSLRQMVWRKKCKTFDEAVKAAAEEEVVEASHREEKVLSCIKMESPELATAGLVDKIVAALELREEARSEKSQKIETKDVKKPYKPKPSRREAIGPSDEEDEEGDEEERPGRNYASPPNRSRQMEQRGFYRNSPRYGDQLPLPRPFRNGRNSDERGEWRRSEPRDGRRASSYDHQARQERARALNLCFNCHQPGHLARECFANSRPQPGNGYRRL